ncbi:hypothetical protein GCM10020295_06850 [Streptomyces cinereospinus]
MPQVRHPAVGAAPDPPDESRPLQPLPAGGDGPGGESEVFARPSRSHRPGVQDGRERLHAGGVQAADAKPWTRRSVSTFIRRGRAARNRSPAPPRGGRRPPAPSA